MKLHYGSIKILSIAQNEMCLSKLDLSSLIIFANSVIDAAFSWKCC